MTNKFLRHVFTLFSLYGCKPVVHELGTYGSVTLTEGWQEEVNSTYEYISEAERKLPSSVREARRPHWDHDLNEHELTFYFTKDSENTMGGRVVPNILRITLFNPALPVADMPAYLTSLANKSFHHDGVGGLATRQFTKLSEHVWKSESEKQRSDLLGLTDVTERWFVADDPARKLRILLTTRSDFYSEKDSLELLHDVQATLKIDQISTYFSGPVSKFKTFYISEPAMPFIADKEITSYDWNNQIIYLNRDPGEVGFRNVTLGDKVLFRFEIISPFSARLITTPVAYKVEIDGNPALILRPVHDFATLAAPDPQSPKWSLLFNQELRTHFDVLGEIQNHEDPERLMKIFK